MVDNFREHRGTEDARGEAAEDEVQLAWRRNPLPLQEPAVLIRHVSTPVISTTTTLD